jgi:hypothetical protein
MMWQSPEDLTVAEYVLYAQKVLAEAQKRVVHHVSEKEEVAGPHTAKAAETAAFSLTKVIDLIEVQKDSAHGVLEKDRVAESKDKIWKDVKDEDLREIRKFEGDWKRVLCK